MDRQLRAQVTGEVRAAMRAIMEEYQEQYVTGEELTRQFGFISKDWLKRYGHLLPRTQAIVSDETDGREHQTGWGYALHKISRMVADGSIKELRNAKMRDAEKAEGKAGTTGESLQLE